MKTRKSIRNDWDIVGNGTLIPRSSKPPTTRNRTLKYRKTVTMLPAKIMPVTVCGEVPFARASA